MTTESTPEIERRTMTKVTRRLLPFLMVCYLFCLIDRGNVGMASLQMNKDLGFSEAAFGFGASLFFVSYFLAEVPSNLMLQRLGARIWIARIMVTWGLASAAMALVRGPTSFYVGRFLLGAAEAGFFPGVILYLTYWLPDQYRGRIVALFAIAIPLASFVGSPISGLLLTMDGALGLRGWQWLFLLEGLPAAVLGLMCLMVLPDRPADARWLDPTERAWLEGRLEGEASTQASSPGIRALFGHGPFWAMVLACVSASAAGTVLGVWQPQLIRSFGLTGLQTGLVNSIPYGVAAIVMLVWGLHSDRTAERRWHTAIPLGAIAIGILGTFLATGLPLTVALLALILIGAYAFKGPFWSLVSGWLPASQAAVGIATINAVANLIGGGLMVNIYGWIHQRSGSSALALLPVALTALASLAVLLLVSRRASPMAAGPAVAAV